MQTSTGASPKCGSIAFHRSPTPPLDSSSEEIDDLCMPEPDLDDLDEISEEGPRKPHFLDYDYLPGPPSVAPSIIEDQPNADADAGAGAGADAGASASASASARASEMVHVDKKFERDGEISDCEIVRPKEKSEFFGVPFASSSISTGARRKKQQSSLSAGFERTGDQTTFKYERKHSLDRDRVGRRAREPSYTLSRFMECDISPVYRGGGTWPVDRPTGDAHANAHSTTSLQPGMLADLGPKVECVYSLLSMLGSPDSAEMSHKFFELSRTPDTCAALRRSGCIPLLVQMLYSDADEVTRKRAGMALHNVVYCHPDDKAGRREAKVLRLIEQVMEYCEFLKSTMKSSGCNIYADDADRHPSHAISSLMRISFDEEHRHAMCQLGALQAIANLVHLDHAAHGARTDDARCVSLRRYAGMALTNLTFGDGNNKALLCSNKEFMKALVAQLDATTDDLLQVTASVLRNLSWRADSNMKAVLNEIGTVTALAKAAMSNTNENTLKAILSALWNLSAHCSTNKAEFCAVAGALIFLVDMLMFEAPSKTLTIVENAGGILRNVSSHIAVREDYRKILRQRDCLGILLHQLKSESLTVVSNACGTLWNLSARCPEDQRYLWSNGAVPMLRSLIHSKHKMISNGSSAALKNLLNFRPSAMGQIGIDPIAKSLGIKELPGLNARKQRALEQELDQNLTETCENLDVTTPPKEEQNMQDFSDPEKLNAVSGSLLSRLGARSNASSSHIVTDEVAAKMNAASKPVELKEEILTSPESEDAVEKDDKTANVVKSTKKVAGKAFGDYQETDLDQITDYSLRYAENQQDIEDVKRTGEAARPTPAAPHNYGNEIILVLDDSVKCYQTEGTPYTISNATSMSDLRAQRDAQKEIKEKPTKVTSAITVSSSGINTPEKPVNYCEEGTPVYFSHRGSLSSLDESPAGAAESKSQLPADSGSEKGEKSVDTVRAQTKVSITPGGGGGSVGGSVSGSIGGGVVGGSGVGGGGGSGSVPKAVTFVDCAQETPLMFSRGSSMESLGSAEPTCGDDRSSVVSEFSRLASGIISPSELPDSPLQSVPQSPRRLVANNCSSVSVVNGQSRIPNPDNGRSVFEDGMNAFGVENTPALFSGATSLSNLSFDDEGKITTDLLTKEMRLLEHSSEEHEDEMVELVVNGDKKPIEVCVSRDEEATDDDLLLATCINIGMNRPNPPSKDQSTIQKPVPMPRTRPADDLVRQYYTENTPAELSKAGSTSNLSILSLETNKADTVLTDDSGSDVGASDLLLEQCIRDGMSKTTSVSAITVAATHTMNIHNQDPLQMMRTGSLRYPLIQANDEMNRFTLEDSPCNFSIFSGLSDITVGSEIAGPAKIQSSEKVSTDPGSMAFRPFNCEDSLSSISIDSEDDGNLLSQAIAAGSSPKERRDVKKLSMPLAVPKAGTSHTTGGDPANDSLSSLESSGSGDNANSLLAQCIRVGMNKSSAPSAQPQPSARRSGLPPSHTTGKSPTKVERQRVKERDKFDEQLLLECISAGIEKPRPLVESQIRPPIRHTRQTLEPNDFIERLSHLSICDASPSKNGATTSAVVAPLATACGVRSINTTAITAPDVGMQCHDGTAKRLNDDQTSPARLHRPASRANNAPAQPAATVAVAANQVTQNQTNGFSSDLKMLTSLNNSSGCNLLECSNEYPALATSSHGNFFDDSVSAMEMSNEFMIGDVSEMSSTRSAMDKHKDPDLMLKSVDRLTQELVSTAEFLRTASDTTTTTTTNTWNENTCPNDVSFPSISIMPPSLNEEEQTPTNEKKKPVVEDEWHKFGDNTNLDETVCYDSAPNSLDDDINVLTNRGIMFELGGKVSATVSSGVSTAATSSSMIAYEATKIANELRDMYSMADSVTSLIDLDHIRPPSEMDFVSMTPQSPQLSSIRVRKKSLPAGLVAHRALGGGGGLTIADRGSLESINSSYKLDAVKPPSIMDELLDSMISVESIMSEVADVSNGTRYETANGDCISELDDDDATPTLMSCQDLPGDSCSTPIPSDFSSVESTPTKRALRGAGVKRQLTPKQKRQLIKDRYRTYTIAADMVLRENTSGSASDGGGAECEQSNNKTERSDENDEEMIRVAARRPTARERRQEDRSRFETQVVQKPSAEIPPTPQHRRQRNTENVDRYRTQTIITSHDDSLKNVLAEANVVLDALNKTWHAASEECLFDDGSDTLSLVSNDDDLDEMSSIRALTAKLTHLKDLVVPATTTRKQMLYPSESDYNSMEFEQSSETESCDQNVATSDTEPLIVPIKTRPRIIKPAVVCAGVESSNGSEDGESTQSPDAKSVRGRKRPVYVSPYKASVVTSRVSSPKSTTSGASKSPKDTAALNNQPARANLATKSTTDARKSVSKFIPRQKAVVTKTHVVINKTNLTNKMNIGKSNLARPGFASAKTVKTNKSNQLQVPTKQPFKPNVSAPAAIERQGTFVKDEPTVDVLPHVTSAPPSPARTSRLPTKIQTLPKTSPTTRLRVPLQKSASMETTATKTTTRWATATRKPTTSPADSSVGAIKRRSFGIGAVQKSPSTPSVPVSHPARPISNGAFRGTVTRTAPPSRSNSNVAGTPKVPSRLPNVQWRPKSAALPAKPTVAAKPPVAAKLIRSSTFDSSTNDQQNGAETVTLSPPSALERLAKITGRMRQEAAASKLPEPRFLRSPSTNGIRNYSNGDAAFA